MKVFGTDPITGTKAWREVLPATFFHGSEGKISIDQGFAGNYVLSYPREHFPNVAIGEVHTLRFGLLEGGLREEQWTVVAIGSIGEARGEWVTLERLAP